MKLSEDEIYSLPTINASYGEKVSFEQAVKSCESPNIQYVECESSWDYYSVMVLCDGDTPKYYIWKGGGEPEDQCFGRDFSTAQDIIQEFLKYLTK